MEAVALMLTHGSQLHADVLVDAVEVAFDAADLLRDAVELLTNLPDLLPGVANLHEDLALRVGLAAGRRLAHALDDRLDLVALLLHDLEVVLDMIVKGGLQLLLSLDDRLDLVALLRRR